MQLKSHFIRLFITIFPAILFISGINETKAQNNPPKIFDASWRGFDTGIFADGSGFAPASVAFGDLDGDGDADALVGNSHFALTGITVLKNNGNGTFAAPVIYSLPYGQSVGEAAVADFDGDGDLDAYASIRGANDDAAAVRVWRNNGDGTFAASVSFTTGQAPAGIVVADLTGDGKPDVATANTMARSVSILKHNGQTGASAGYLAPVDYAVSTSFTQTISAGDVNRDGKLDLAVGGFDSATNEVLHSVFINDGSGNFAAPVNYQSAPGSRIFSYAVALRDIDNDGDADLLGGGIYSVGSADYGALTVRRSNGGGVFGNAEIFQFELGVPSPRKITIGDLNGDGSPDIIAAVPSGRASEGYEVIMSNGTGGFLAPKNYETSQQPFDVAAIDVDRDGDQDVLTLANSSAALTVHPNPGNGNFFVPVRSNVAAFSDAVESADIDNDGDIDIVVNGEVGIASNSAIVKILKNNGDGTFAVATDYNPPRNFADMKLRDINGDGFVDLVFAPDDNYPLYHLGTALNNGNGTFAPTVVIPLNGCGGGTIDAADLDSDGDRDIVFVEELSCQNIPARIFILRNNGSQNFTILPPITPPGLPHGLALVDATGDGRLDIVAAVSGTMRVYPNGGNLTFGAPISTAFEPYKFTTADFNGDGRVDLGMIMPQSSFGTDTIATALGNGNGTFQPARPQTGSSVLENLRIASDLDAADFNGDGKIDLLTYNYASNDVSLFLNAGDGALRPHQRYGIGHAPRLGTAADFNRDGKIDIAAAIGLPPLGLSDAVVVLRNAGQAPTRRASFDFDGDGKADVSIFRPTGGEWWIQKSTGNVSAFQFGSSTDKIIPADYTGDGKTDAAFWRPSSGEWFILRSEDNSFYAFPFGSNGDVPVSGDYDGDGKADAAVFRPSNGAWYVLKSSGGVTIQQFGISEDKPVAADYDGDGKTDIAVYRPSSGVWHLLRSRDGYDSRQFGIASDKPVPADYDGDGKTDLAVYRSGVWWMQLSRDGNLTYQFGLANDIPAPADYDGDGKADIAVYREGVWYLQRTASGFTALQFGLSSDTPVPAALIR